MKKLLFLLSFLTIYSCGDKANLISEAQNIVDRSIADAGGDLYKTSNIAFDFRDMDYVLQIVDGRRIMKRMFGKDSSRLVDVVGPNGFQRFVNDNLIHVSDSMANVFSNSINSVHYFAYLPCGLDDPAVNKALLGGINRKGAGY